MGGIKDKLNDFIKGLEEKNQREGQARDLVSAIQREQTTALKPVFEELGRQLIEKISQVQINVPETKINIPETKLPEYPKFPEIPQPNITLRPNINVPPVDVKMPEEMRVTGEALISNSRKRPVPALLVDETGKAISFTQFLQGGGFEGGGPMFAKLLDDKGNPYTTNNTLPTSTTLSGSMEVKQVSGFVDSVNLQQIGGNTVVVGSGYSDNALRVVHATDVVSSFNLTQINGNTVVVGAGASDNALRVVHASDVLSSFNLMQVNGNSVVVGAGASDNAIRVVHASDVLSSFNLMQVNGNSVVVGVGTSDNAIRVVHASDIISSFNLMQVSGNSVVVGSGYSDNALRIVHASDVGVSTSTAGDIAHDAADSGNPVKVGMVARTANATAVANGDRVNATGDKLGRILNRPIQLREVLASAYGSVASGTETTLKAAVAGSYLDLIYIMLSNNSDAAVTADIRMVTAGNVVMSIQVPANGVAGVSIPTPYPQSDSGNNWTIDLPDVTGTTVYWSALFSQEV